MKDGVYLGRNQVFVVGRSKLAKEVRPVMMVGPDVLGLRVIFTMTRGEYSKSITSEATSRNCLESNSRKV
jgi:hypothetical protein